MTTSRRDFLHCAALGVLPVLPVLAQGGAGQDTTKQQAGGVAPDRLGEPMLGGRLVDSTDKWDNDAGIIAIERRLRCRCGCMLDVYTCRTTDFTCTYSPEMHREVIAMVVAGKTPEQVMQAFVARRWRKGPDGAAGLGLQPRRLSRAGPGDGGHRAGTCRLSLPPARGRGRDRWRDLPGAAVPTSGGPDQEQLERLQRALDEVES